MAIALQMACNGAKLLAAKRAIDDAEILALSGI
jgi:hypothetical protein